jgi:hypothetical protein
MIETESINRIQGQYWRHYQGCDCLKYQTETAHCGCLSVVELTLAHIRKYDTDKNHRVSLWRFDNEYPSEFIDVRVMFQLTDLGYLTKEYGCYNSIEFIYTRLTNGKLD